MGGGRHITLVTTSSPLGSPPGRGSEEEIRRQLCSGCACRPHTLYLGSPETRVDLLHNIIANLAWPWPGDDVVRPRPESAGVNGVAGWGLPGYVSPQISSCHFHSPCHPY